MVEDHRATIAERLRALRPDHRADRGRGHARAAHGGEIAAELKGGLSDRTAFFVLCEVLGHLDQLIDEGAVVEHLNGDGVSRFATA